MELSITSSYQNDQQFQTVCQTVQWNADLRTERNVVNLYPDIEYEALEGFGGAITDAAAYVYSLMNTTQKKNLLETYFAPDKMNYGIVRIHMDSCDFSTEMYEAMSDETDRTLKTFSFARTEKYIIPMLEDAQRISGKKLEIMLSPWSPPKFMKTNDSRVRGGSLKPEYKELWAEYICRYIREFRDRGYAVRRISLQNEPKASQPWDSCVYTAEEEKVFLRDFMHPALVRNQLDDVEVFIWDHNKERIFERIRDICDEKTEPLFAGVAFHWYSGDHFEALDLVRQKFPGKKLILSESCIEYSRYNSADTVRNAVRLSHEIIGDLNHGMTAFYDWNILLDEKGGPNHAGNFCQAPFLYDIQREELMPQVLQKHIEHFSHYISPQSVRIAWSKYTDEIDVTAYKRTDGKIVVVMLSKVDKEKEINLRWKDLGAKLTLPPQGIVTGVIVP